MDVMRAKGMVYDGTPQRFILQSVYDMYDILPAGEWKQDEQLLSRFVFIGKASHCVDKEGSWKIDIGKESHLIDLVVLFCFSISLSTYFHLL